MSQARRNIRKQMMFVKNHMAELHVKLMEALEAEGIDFVEVGMYGKFKMPDQESVDRYKEIQREVTMNFVKDNNYRIFNYKKPKAPSID